VERVPKKNPRTKPSGVIFSFLAAALAQPGGPAGAVFIYDLRLTIFDCFIQISERFFRLLGDDAVSEESKTVHP